MTRRKKRWLIGIGSGLTLTVVALFIAASMLSRRIEPFIRDQAVQYMSERFNSQVELAALRIRLPKTPPLRLLFTRGKGGIARVEGDGISMRFHGDRERPPLFAIQKFSFEVDLGTLTGPSIVVSRVFLDGVKINIPPKEERPKVAASQPEPAKQEGDGGGPKVLIQDVRMTGTSLSILPRDRSKVPLHFAIHNLQLETAGPGLPMKYHAVLTNPKPPGTIDSHGTFGPWKTEEPSDTPLQGKYVFEKADLGVFAGIAGILNSTGEFKGALSSIEAKGEATVPDFRLKRSGNPVSLKTNFEVMVDGTNGNTVLKPVRALLGRTAFTTSGGVIKHEGDRRRSIDLDVIMPNGDLRDLLKLAMKGPSFMEGRINLKTKISVPPLSGKVKEKLLLDGRFEVSDGKFLKSTIQDQIDSFSRKGQGQPKNEAIDEVVLGMKGLFHLENEVLTFKDFSFAVPGALVELAGDYNMDADALDFRGALKLDARVSQTMTGWKRWALKPVDPFFAKNGAGTFLKIKVAGTSREPKFGLDRGRKDDETRAREGSKR